MQIVDYSTSERRIANDSAKSDSRFQLEPFVIIDDVEVERQLEKLYSIRADTNRFLTPAFLLSPEADETRCLSDGRVSDFEEAYERAGRIERRAGSLSGSERLLDETDRLMRFLDTRIGFEVRPIRDWKDPRSYRYPLLDAFREFETDSRAWLAALQKNEFIEPAGDIVDRIRHCRACDSAHLNYVDLCPSCASLQIKVASFFHCFGCGYVGEERFFQEIGRRTCPKCSRVLRHIGIDYDRALQSFTCSDCGSSFSDAKIAARCLSCSREFDPANLNAREVRSWKLSRAGRIAARSGVALTQDDGSLSSLVSKKRFADLVAWAQRTRQCYAQAQFGLLLLRVDYVDATSSAKCDVDFSQALWQRVRATVRGSEVVGEGALDSLWIFCPHTDPASLKALQQRIESIGDAIDVTVTGPIRLRVSAVHSNDIPVEDHPENLLEHISR